MPTKDEDEIDRLRHELKKPPSGGSTSEPTASSSDHGDSDGRAMLASSDPEESAPSKLARG